MKHHVCELLADRPNIYGEYACKHWTVQQSQQSLLEALAITPEQAGEISLAIIASLLLGFLFGELGSFLKSMAK